MSIQQAYNSWASQYDSNDNKTRDLEAFALRETLSPIAFDNCLEIGCGTGKNTVWLIEKAKQVTAVDLSEEMMAKAKLKAGSANVQFKQADITAPWTFGEAQYDLVSFSLVLEHIENLDPVFKETAAALKPGGHVYIGELHPFKQYAGSKARFETEQGVQVVDCFNHHISDFTRAANQCGLVVESVNEYFDNNDRKELPRLLVLLLIKGNLNNSFNDH
ncbi:MAG TPA: class I SAM-dependent methyltransferase [Chitinophagaceae bacterium]|jgi:ubiquinone/menaquinone biosynthesis C-methylase UbiE|nr:class I SAM-dependent methyltransferase [Chitinophagaceae bacterium]